MCSGMHGRPPAGRVTPFGHLRISGCLLLPIAFRSLPRPSSSDSSKASTVNSFSLDHIPFSSSFRCSPHARVSVVPYPRALRQHPRGQASCMHGVSPLLFTCQRSRSSASSEANGRTESFRRLRQSTSELEVRGFEPLTYGLQSHRSSQLSYTPDRCKPGRSNAQSAPLERPGQREPKPR